MLSGQNQRLRPSDIRQMLEEIQRRLPERPTAVDEPFVVPERLMKSSWVSSSNISLPSKSLQEIANLMAAYLGIITPVEVRYVNTSFGTAGTYRVLGHSYRVIEVAATNSDFNVDQILATLAHESTHHYLHEHKVQVTEIMTDLTAVYLGFGELLYRGYKTVERYRSRTKVGYIQWQDVKLAVQMAVEMRGWNIPLRPCPFCKSHIRHNIEQCPHCHRILREHVERKETVPQAPPHRQKRRHITFLKDNFAYWLSKIWDHFLYIELAAMGLLVLLGLYLAHNQSLRQSSDVPLPVVTEAVKQSEDGFGSQPREYGNIFQSVGSALASNVQSVATFQGTKLDYLGRTVNEYKYDNADLDIALFQQKWDALKSEYDLLRVDLENGNVQDRTNVLNSFKTDLFFCANELWDRAYENDQIETISQLQTDLSTIIHSPPFARYLQESQLSQPAFDVLSGMTDSIGFLRTKYSLNLLERNLQTCRSNPDCSDEKQLVDHFNQLLPDYNSNINDASTMFSQFMKLVDVYLLFPGQNTL